MSTNDPERDQQPQSQPQPLDPEPRPAEPPAPISHEAATRAAAEADAARAGGTGEGKSLADAIDQRMYIGGTEPVPGTGQDMDSVPEAGDPFRESDLAAAERPPDVQFPAGNPETIYDESPETPATRPPSATTGTGSSIAIGCVVAAVVIVLIVILVLTIVS
jgi:hypothetical protein